MAGVNAITIQTNQEIWIAWLKEHPNTVINYAETYPCLIENVTDTEIHCQMLFRPLGSKHDFTLHTGTGAGESKLYTLSNVFPAPTISAHVKDSKFAINNIHVAHYWATVQNHDASHEIIFYLNDDEFGLKAFCMFEVDLAFNSSTAPNTPEILVGVQVLDEYAELLITNEYYSPIISGTAAIIIACAVVASIVAVGVVVWWYRRRKAAKSYGRWGKIGKKTKQRERERERICFLMCCWVLLYSFQLNRMTTDEFELEMEAEEDELESRSPKRLARSSPPNVKLDNH